MSPRIAQRLAGTASRHGDREEASGEEATVERGDRSAATTPVVIHARITRNGLHMAFVAAFAILGGSIRGFNLLVVLAGLMVGVLLVQWRLCRGMLPRISVRRILPIEAYAERPFKVRFAVTNGRSWLPAWMIRAEDRIRGGRGRARDGQAICSLGVVHPRSTESVSYDCTLMRRGRYHFGPVRITSGFPLGLVQAWQNTRTRSTMLVYPSLARLTPHWGEMILNRREGLSGSRQRSGQSDGEFFGIRSWQSGDSRRWIHWRTTARIQSLAVRQFEQPSKMQLSLILDPYLQNDGEDSDVEWAISVTASIVLALSAGGTNHLGLGIADAAARSLVSHRTFDFRRGAMGVLANTRPMADPPLARTLERVLRDGNPNWPIVIISPRPQRLDLLVGDGSSSRNDGSGGGGSGLSAALISRLDLIWLDVTSPSAESIAFREGAHGTT